MNVKKRFCDIFLPDDKIVKALNNALFITDDKIRFITLQNMHRVTRANILKEGKQILLKEVFARSMNEKTLYSGINVMNFLLHRKNIEINSFNEFIESLLNSVKKTNLNWENSGKSTPTLIGHFNSGSKIVSLLIARDEDFVEIHLKSELQFFNYSEFYTKKDSHIPLRRIFTNNEFFFHK